MNAAELDHQDPLASFRSRFRVEDDGLIYLDGNSLGRMPLDATRVVGETLDEWSGRLVRAWGESWIHLPSRIGDKIAGIIGAKPGEVLVCDSTSVNFFKLACAALRARPGRTKIVTDDLNFPSDLYLLQGIAAQLGVRHQIEVVRSPDGIHGAPISDHLDSNTALVTLTHTGFKSGFVYDMAKITEQAHACGALVLWDLSHSVGSVPVELDKADLAVGCTYKYLNGGPGSPAFLYVREVLHDELESPIWGWFGQDRPFDFGLQYSPAKGVRRFMAGTPSILSLRAVECGVDLCLEAGMAAIRAKSVLLTEFLIDCWERRLRDLGVTLNSPRGATVRGSHISFGHPEGLRIDQALIEKMNVIPDFRYPDNIRFGAVPLYTTFEEIEEAIERFRRVIVEKIYEEFPEQPPEVT